MHDRMPGPRSQASEGGPCPRTNPIITETNIDFKGDREDEVNEVPVDEKREGTWVKGGSDEDRKRYEDFLKYCEERREEMKRTLEEDDERKRRAEEKERHWELMRISIKYLKENEPK